MSAIAEYPVLRRPRVAPKRPYLTVVAGLPGSGRAHLMSVLESGGLPILTDSDRLPDEDHPWGFSDFEPVKSLKTDSTWVAESLGQTVKMVHILLYDLPEHVNYRVVFMNRRLDEVLSVQNRLLDRLGKPNHLDDTRCARVFLDQLKKLKSWLAARPNFQVLNVDYNALLDDPLPNVVAINKFLGGGLDLAAMAVSLGYRLYTRGES